MTKELVDVTLYQITKRGEYREPLEWNAIFHCKAKSMGDAFRQAVQKGISCHDIDWNKSHPAESEYEDKEWEYGLVDLEGLDLRGLYVSYFPVAHSDNYITKVNLRKSVISLIRPKDLSMIDCDLRGAWISWEDDCYFLDFHDSVFDSNTELRDGDLYQDGWNMLNTIYENNGLYKTASEKVVYLGSIKDEKLEKALAEYKTKIVSDITECNLAVVKDINKIPQRVLVEKWARNIGVIELSSLKFYYFVED